jgi:hypothetical protein
MDGGPYFSTGQSRPMDIVTALGGDSADGLFGVSSSGTVLWQRWNGAAWLLNLSVPSGASSTGYLTYTIVDPTQAGAPQVDTTEAALSFDGSTLIVRSEAQDALEEAAIQGRPPALGPLSQGHFVAFNQSLQGSIIYPSTLTADGLTFYYEIGNAPDPAADGIYSTTRTSIDAQFPAGTLLPADIQQAFMSVGGISSDQLTAFFTDYSWNMHVITRGSKDSPWSATPNGAPTPAIPYYFNGFPTADCRYLFVNCTPGGVDQSRICQLPRL